MCDGLSIISIFDQFSSGEKNPYFFHAGRELKKDQNSCVIKQQSFLSMVLNPIKNVNVAELWFEVSIANRPLIFNLLEKDRCFVFHGF